MHITGKEGQMGTVSRTSKAPMLPCSVVRTKWCLGCSLNSWQVTVTLPELFVQRGKTTGGALKLQSLV